MPGKPGKQAAGGGTMPDPPHWLRQSQEKQAHAQRQPSRMQPGSRNYQDAVRECRLLHGHTANQRRGFIHKESRRIPGQRPQKRILRFHPADEPVGI